MCVVTTFLEIHSVDEIRPRRCDDPRFRVLKANVPQWRFNRFLYQLVGEQWQWRYYLTWSDEQWRERFESPQVHTFVGYCDGSPAGYYELGLDEAGHAEILHFGLAPAFIGRGYGGPLLTSALEEGFRLGAGRVWVHTCTNDHPAALANYQARGMAIYKTETGID